MISRDEEEGGATIIHPMDRVPLFYRTVNDLFRELALKETPFHACPITVEEMGALVDMVQKNTITGKIGKDVLHIMLQEGGGHPQDIVDKKGWARIDDSALLKSMCEDLVAKHTQQVCKGDWKLVNTMVFILFYRLQSSRKAKRKCTSGLLVKSCEKPRAWPTPTRLMQPYVMLLDVN